MAGRDATRHSTERRRLPAEERREHLLDVAADLLTRQSVDALTMEAIAGAAGVSKGLGYAYFRNIDDLLVALYAREARAVYEAVLAAAQAVTGFEPKIRAAVHAYFGTVADRGRLFSALRSKLVDRAAPGAEARAEHDRINVQAALGYETFLVDVVIEEFSVSRRDARAVAGVMLATADACMRAWAALRIPRDQAEEMCARYAIAGARGVFSRT